MYKTKPRKFFMINQKGLMCRQKKGCVQTKPKKKKAAYATKAQIY